MSLFFFLKGALIGYLLAVVTILDLELGDLTTVIGIAAGCLALYSAFAFLDETKSIRKPGRKRRGEARAEALAEDAKTARGTTPEQTSSATANVGPRLREQMHATPQSAIVAARNRIRCRSTQNRFSVGTA